MNEKIIIKKDDKWLVENEIFDTYEEAREKAVKLIFNEII